MHYPKHTMMTADHRQQVVCLLSVESRYLDLQVSSPMAWTSGEILSPLLPCSLMYLHTDLKWTLHCCRELCFRCSDIPIKQTIKLSNYCGSITMLFCRFDFWFSESLVSSYLHSIMGCQQNVIHPITWSH